MFKYASEDDAAHDGIEIVHEPQLQRYAVYRSTTAERRLVGEAHYSLSDGVIDFDHTVVDPPLRGTGLSAFLAHRALTGSAIGDRRVSASCWFIAGYIVRHPELHLKR